MINLAPFSIWITIWEWLYRHKSSSPTSGQTPEGIKWWATAINRRIFMKVLWWQNHLTLIPRQIIVTFNLTLIELSLSVSLQCQGKASLEEIKWTSRSHSTSRYPVFNSRMWTLCIHFFPLPVTGQKNFLVILLQNLCFSCRIPGHWRFWILKNTFQH